MHNKVKIRIRVQMEPDLEKIAGHLPPGPRRELGRRFFRYSKQLFISADILEREAKPKPPPRKVPFYPEHKLKRN